MALCRNPAADEGGDAILHNQQNGHNAATYGRTPHFHQPSTLLLLPLLLLLLASSPPPQLYRQFDPSRAMEHLKKQVDFGPRPSGSEELSKTRAYLVSELRSYGYEVTEQAFVEDTLRGRIRFVNVIARLPASVFARKKPVVLLGSHYDTKWMPEIRFVGANDSASSTAVLLEIARVVAQTKFEAPKSSIEFVFFDGEEALREYTEKDGLYGSRHYVKQLKAASPDGKIKGVAAMILLDMVGDRVLEIEMRGVSDDLKRHVLEAADAVGHRDHFRYSSLTMTDDQKPFEDEGVPAIDLIDFQYGIANHWWHTKEDTVDKLDTKSLKIAGETVLKMLEGM